jgi:hypothetical protein
MGEKKYSYKDLVRKSEGKRPLRRLICGLDDNIKMNLKEKGWEDAVLIHLAQDGDQWEALVNTVMNLRVPQNAENFFTS